MTKYQVIIIGFFTLLSSCATYLNSPVQKISISADKKIQVVSVDRSILKDGTGLYHIPRSNNPLIVKLQIDSAQKTVTLLPKSSFAYWFNIYCNYGIGMLVDKDNPKRYGYPRRNYFKLHDSTIKRVRFAPIKKGTVNLSLSLPFTTIFNVQTIDNHQNSAGVLGLEAGVDYFYRNNTYLSINVGAATDRFGEYFGPGYVQTATTLYTSLRNNHVVGSFDLGYGFNVSRPKWTIRTLGDTIQINESVKSIGLGLSLSAQCRIGNYFRLGMLYQPNLLNTSFKPSFNYQHYISLNLVWKLPF
jgi:hypothetical protein